MYVPLNLLIFHEYDSLLGGPFQIMEETPKMMLQTIALRES